MSNDTLVLLHTIFRHGERAPDKSHQYPNDPYINHDFAPYGSGQLTNVGKKSMYDLGEHMRNIYDDYLGDQYMPQYVNAYATDSSRTKASLQLFLASLYPPKGDNIWHENLNWQPIPYTVYESKDDNLLGNLVAKPEFLSSYAKNFEAGEGRKFFETHHEVLEYIRKHSGAKIKYTRDIWLMLGLLVTEKQFGLTLPEWTKAVFPDKMIELALLEYKMQTATKELMRFNIGRLVEKILKDTKAKIDKQSQCKIHVYSAHDFNVAHFLMYFGVMYPHFPNYAACAILEVHQIDNKYGFKLKYRPLKTAEFGYLTFPNGSQFLELEKFEKMVEKLLQ
ncbi:Histidine phosphatase superfamily (branch 2) [Popillia japonica]|uniref:acid phosphatase n=1 Tax=Popillia japonica TaxID=7064 RepID=A0AAW1HUB9_POPJA